MWTGDILKHLASLPPSLLVTFYFSPLSSPLTFSSLCFGDSGDFTLLKGVCCFLPNAAHVLLSGPSTSTDLVLLRLFFFQRLCSHA